MAIELQPNPVQALDRHIAARGAQDIVHPMYGVNQADRERLARIMVDEFGGESIDLVIDDASHLYHESRVSFDVLYPRLRPGGLYLLEDWRCQHMIANSLTTALETSDEVRREVERRMTEEGWTGPATPMSRLVVELLIARAISGDIVAEMTVGPHWVAVRRGPAELDVEGFNLDDHAPDHTHLLASIR
ncbi:MAG: class I SAM-dependent methyltransferase [Acidimicrobiia bacterium]|nr:class I SAM-dependent methyltransferase [Acidimicrobiia bacterium]